VEWVVDRNGDGYADDVATRIVLAPPSGTFDRQGWAALVDLAARIGLETHALPFPLVVPDGVPLPDGVATVVLREPEDIPAFDTGLARQPSGTIPPQSSPSRCLTHLFTCSGALEDDDGDLLPDASRLTFVLPDTLPVALGAAVANLAARLGLESGGVTFPLVRPDGAPCRIAPSSGPAVVRSDAGGWVAEGDPADLAALLETVAAGWPHLTAPETGGATAALATLRRWLAGDGPEPHTPGAVVWQRDWSAPWEVDRLRETFERDILAGGLLHGAIGVMVFASEPPAERAALAADLTSRLASVGYPSVPVTVLCAFKAGLSWLRDVVLPALSGQPVARLRITYARLEQDGVLDLPIRWLQELFPGNELLAAVLGLPLDAIEIVPATSADPTYTAEAFAAGGARLGHWHCTPLAHTQPFVSALPESDAVVVTTGGFVIERGAAPPLTVPVRTDLESFWSFWQEEVLPEVLRQIDAQGGPDAAAQPFFGELLVEVWVSEPNDLLGIREENDSAAEALAEDLYFTTLDAIELYGLQRTGERCNAPGAVIPLVHVTPGAAPRARVTLRAAPSHPMLPYPDLAVTALSLTNGALTGVVDVTVPDPPDATLARLRHLGEQPAPAGPTLRVTVRLAGEAIPLHLPLPMPIAPPNGAPASRSPQPALRVPDGNLHGDAILDWAARLAAFPEVTAWVEDYSYQGRPIVALALVAPAPGRLHSPTKAAIFKPTYLIVARHHANEISSTNAAFELALRCATDPAWRSYLDAVNVVLLPYENPDGAALHARLAAEPEARRWKHHPARYNALGFEFGFAHTDPDTRYGEARVRPSVWRRWPADVVVDNHGVPSHEWVQPFAGYGSPPRFAVSYWIVQALLYGIIGWVDDPDLPQHRAAAERLRDAVSARVRDTDIGDWNRIYGASYRFWGQEREPERFPGVFHDDMLWHITPREPDPAGRGFAARHPRTTVLEWVTEVNDETAEGEHLARVARAHLLANQATLDLLVAAAPPIRHWRGVMGETVTLRVGRERPLHL
jgi:hypothetical protein